MSAQYWLADSEARVLGPVAIDVVRDLATQIAGGSRRIFGAMIESHLEEGAQAFRPGSGDAAALRYGQSITDACLGWDDSAASLRELARAVRARG